MRPSGVALAIVLSLALWALIIWTACSSPTIVTPIR